MNFFEKENSIHAKKKRAKIPHETKIRAELQKEIGSTCPFCINGDVGHFEIHHIDGNPSNNDKNNLLLVCPICHSKITKGDITLLEVINKKNDLHANALTNTSAGNNILYFNNRINNSVVGNNNIVQFRQYPKKSIQKYPEGCIGFDPVKANYISHLIQRYNEYKEYEVGKGNVKYPIFHSKLKRHFKIGPTRTLYHLSIDKFEDLAGLIQTHINQTKLARIKGYTHKYFSTFQEYKEEFGNHSI